MCIRRSSLVAISFLVIATGVGDRQGVFTAPTALLEAQSAPAEPTVGLPNKDGSFKFGVIGDNGTGSRAQYQLGEQMVALHGRFKYDIVVMSGDNLIGSERPQDFKDKFETPYKALLDAGVMFYASLGNHDAREQRFYKLFNMDGRLYYTFSPRPDISFFMLETSYPTPEQFAWLEKELKASRSKWKIAVFHHPIYSSGDRHGSDLRLREVLEPFFVKYNVSVGFNGHDHFYERVKPQQGITYFVAGSGGQLRVGNIDRSSGLTAKGFDTDQAFIGAEIIGDEMYFNAIARQGQTVDSGVIMRRRTAD
jgi:3',5'-cyclic AMP phosphodiesterase CpdA